MVADPDIGGADPEVVCHMLKNLIQANRCLLKNCNLPPEQSYRLQLEITNARLLRLHLRTKHRLKLSA